VQVRAVAVAASCLALLAACDTDDGRDFSRPPTSDQNQSVLTTAVTSAPTSTFVPGSTSSSTLPPAVVGEEELTLRLPWADEGLIDPAYTCEGFGVAPTVEWSGAPVGTAELGLALIDLDAQGFVHWVVTGIPAGTTSLIEGVIPPGAVSPNNDFGDPGYGGPCPPEGEHRYLLTLYALTAPLGLEGDVSANEAINAMEAASIAQVSAAGRYAAGGAPLVSDTSDTSG
jgi:Raf kinase inhibitor-like YbhB/YbcL family protein